MLRQLLVKSLNTAHLPPRPGVTVLSDSIPLFYIGRNHEGFWVVREAEGRIGGLFLLRCSALRFARQKSLPAGCATMFVTEPLELDLPNQGSRVAEPIASAMRVTKQRVPLLANLVATAAAKWRKLVSQILRPIAVQRRNHVAIEKEQLHGEYTLISKTTTICRFRDDRGMRRISLVREPKGGRT
jgi:hypothetical protein